MSLWSWGEINEYRKKLEEAGLFEEVERLTNELASNLRDYWEKVARVLGRLEGVAIYYSQSPELERVKELAGDVVEAYLHELVALREEYSVASHNFMYETMYSNKKGLYFMGQVFKINTRDLERVAYPKKKQLERTKELRTNINDAMEALFQSAQYVTNVVGLIGEIDKLLGQADLEPAWDEGRVDVASIELERKEWELLGILEDLGELIDIALSEAGREPG
jgi:sugar-specific transcriptional regulator TrmB